MYNINIYKEGESSRNSRLLDLIYCMTKLKIKVCDCAEVCHLFTRSPFRTETNASYYVHLNNVSILCCRDIGL